MSDKSPFYPWKFSPVQGPFHDTGSESVLNPHFSFQNEGPFQNRNERDLIRSLHKETIQIHGVKILYIPRKFVQMNFLFGEDPLSKFDEKYEIAAYMENYDGFSGGPDLITKFGMEVKDEAIFTVSGLHFLEITGKLNPKEGDLVYLPVADNLMEIKFVEEENQFYPLGQQMSYKIRCQSFDYTYEDITTGSRPDEILEQNPLITVLDDIDPHNADNLTVQESTDPVIDFDENNPMGNY